MPLRHDPFRDLRDSFSLLGAPVRLTSMPADVYRGTDAYLIQIDIPGARPDTIDVTVKKNTVIVSAEATRAPESDLDLLLSERSHGRLTRQIALGEDIDADAVQAEYTDGVLMLHLPLALSSKPQRIAVTTPSPREISVG